MGEHVAGEPARPRLLVIACGGTISSVRSGAGASPRLSAAELVSDLPELAELAAVETATFSAAPSPHVSMSDVLHLHADVERYLSADPTLSGVVVTHGTDTLEEVAFALDLLWEHHLPLVVTGAMRNRSLPGADGPANLVAAAATALAPAARGLGVLVVMNDEIHAASFVRKGHTANVATFQSPTVGRLGYLTEGTPRLIFAPLHRQTLGPPLPRDVATVPVALLKMSIGDDGRLLQYLAQAGFRGVVIEGFGGGHVTREVAESRALRELVKIMPVVLASRAGAGEPLRATYSGFPGSETDLMSRGLISSGALDGPKSRVLLSLLLARGADRNSVGRAFARHGLYGEEA